MIQTRHASDRGYADRGWLKTFHTFSFGEYFDPRYMGFRDLRVINEDRIAGGRGFPPHGHADMEIVTYMLEGELEHRDSLGNGSVLRPGEIQRMSAGRGVTHSEFNASSTNECHLLQIWILPSERGIVPSYEQQVMGTSDRRGRLQLVASPDGRHAGSMRIGQDVCVYAALLEKGEAVGHALGAGRHGFVHVARGAIVLNGESLVAGDGAMASDESNLSLAASESCEVLLFDLP